MSMGDWAEGRPDQKPHLERLWKLCDETPWIDKLMLTKRPQLMPTLYPLGRRRDVWMGVTAENQYWTDLRWNLLKRVDAEVYWLSMEPLFERVDLPADFLSLGKRAWVIVGGHSGSGAKPMNPDWARHLRDQCVSAGIAFHFKQHGEWVQFRDSGLVSITSRHKTIEMEQDMMPNQCRRITMVDVGKKAAGRLLDGRTWDERPTL